MEEKSPQEMKTLSKEEMRNCYFKGSDNIEFWPNDFIIEMIETIKDLEIRVAKLEQKTKIVP